MLGEGHVFLLGDADLNGQVNAADLDMWMTNQFTSNAAWSAGDFSGDGKIDGRDFDIWNDNKFKSSAPAWAVPEPGSPLSYSLAGLAGLGLLARRKQRVRFTRGSAGNLAGMWRSSHNPVRSLVPEEIWNGAPFRHCPHE